MKIRKRDILAPLFIFLIFFVGFVVGGISLIIYGYNHDNDVELIFGLVLACLGLFQISQKYKISYIFIVIPVLLVIVGLLGTSIFILFYLPFFYKESLNLDLGALILKDWFVRLVIIIIDVLLLINIFTYTRKQLSKNKEQEKDQY
ncbi:hypothetical protein [Chryseobacterium culicis]|uniref:hypothetical protein n=1 Tax=Chryseobacterium culicis TaxID=680127 RepID=UPI0018764D97|nr:hypothetical protein [Chryseobacterium culicis]MBE4950885.1 hypothetical protein [Chryseobacterium culicis]